MEELVIAGQSGTLTKSSTENEIKTYFKKVLELKQSGEEFPVNLELVWPLVYARKEEAVRALTSDFIQSIDYQVLRKNAENPVGGRPSDDYHLSVSCMEFFIARKVRPVFEVYRQVFHHVAEQPSIATLSRKELALLVIQSEEENERLQAEMREQKQHTQMLEGENDLLEKENRQLAPKADYTDKVLQSTSTYTMTQVAKEIGMSAVALEKHLHDAGIMFKQSGQWILYAKYQNRDYTKSRTHHYPHSDGTTGTNTITVWTEKGRAFVHQIMKGGTL
jgi:phage antirepressor YoqD-like protein